MMACSCSLIPSKQQVEVISKPIERTIVQPIMPREIDLKDPYWYVVSDKNIEDFLTQIEKDQGQGSVCCYVSTRLRVDGL